MHTQYYTEQYIASFYYLWTVKCITVETQAGVRLLSVDNRRRHLTASAHIWHLWPSRWASIYWTTDEYRLKFVKFDSQFCQIFPEKSSQNIINHINFIFPRIQENLVHIIITATSQSSRSTSQLFQSNVSSNMKMPYCLSFDLSAAWGCSFEIYKYSYSCTMIRAIDQI